MARQPFIIHRNPSGVYRRVSHRETGRFLGEIAQYDDPMHEWCGLWAAWSPHDTDAVGDLYETAQEAAWVLLDPAYHEPGFSTRKCPEHENVIRWCGPPIKCSECETPEQSIARSREENRAMWEHYDWLQETWQHHRQWASCPSR